MDHAYPEQPSTPYVYQEFPRCLYASDGTAKLVTTEEEKMALLTAGWQLLPPSQDAPAPPPEQIVPEVPPAVPEETAMEPARKPRGNPNWLRRG